MSKHGPKSLAVLHHLSRNGAKNRLELERELGMAQLDTHISKLIRGMHVMSLKKERGQLVRYQITKHGMNAIGAHMQEQQSLRYRPLSELPLYVPTQTPVREGSMDAYKLPSRGMR